MSKTICMLAPCRSEQKGVDVASLVQLEQAVAADPLVQHPEDVVSSESQLPSTSTSPKISIL